jgi:hypothetical protein
MTPGLQIKGQQTPGRDFQAFQHLGRIAKMMLSSATSPAALISGAASAQRFDLGTEYGCFD